ncbi:ribonuclease III domain-containing protein [Coniochaeta sp. 2T2.1]|nr:ribonuclease III domain-containing protein [Coniochaeta sp. 2T2.1]
MSKRPHKEVAASDTPQLDAARDRKRVKTSDEDVGEALKTLLTFAANIKASDVAIPETQKDQPLKLDSLPQHLKNDFRSLSRSLLHSLPAVRALAGEEEKEPQQPLPKDEPKVEEEPQPSPQDNTPVKEERYRQTPKDNARGAVQLPSTETLTKWTVADIPPFPPPLPPVLDPILETAAFTHPGMAKRPTDMNYERLEWMGDSYIYTISCGLIYATFPTLAPGKCSQIREILVKNITLCEYSVYYGFDRRADFPAEFGLGGRPGGTRVTPKERTKVLADIFEAYVAAVVLSDPVSGFARASAWLKALWAGTIQQQIRDAVVLEKKATELPAKNQLANLILAKGVKIRYEDAPNQRPQYSRDGRQPLYTVNAYLDGWGETNKLLGWGTAPHKGEAGHRAAQCAMDNKKQIAVYVERKRAHMAALEAQRKEE